MILKNITIAIKVMNIHKKKSWMKKCLRSTFIIVIKNIRKASLQRTTSKTASQSQEPMSLIMPNAS